MTALVLPEPTLSRNARSITATYDTGQKVTEYNKEKSIVLKLMVSYTKAGVNYFTSERVTTDYYQAAVRNALRDGVSESFIMGSGLGLTRIPQESNRFNRRLLGRYFDEWREKIEGMLSLADDQAALLLDPDEFTMREAILPYWNGEKAGLKG